jgi:TetR/AcrR family transcriptional repressor of nem operon
MRYTRDRRQETRDKLLRSSSAIAKKNGFGVTGIDAFMSAIGMAGGTFYHHFKSKDALFGKLIELEMTHSAGMLAVHPALQVEDLVQCLRDYLSPAHALRPEDGCAFTSLGTEISRAGPEIRATAERSLKKLHRDWSRKLGGDEDKAWALLAQCIGAVTLARLVESEITRLEILSANFRKVDQALHATGSAGPRGERARPTGEHRTVDPMGV